MNIQNTNSSNFIIENKNRILFLFILFILSSLRMFGQSSIDSKTIQCNQDVTITFNQVETSIVSVNTQIDFVSWFMGSRQSQMNENETANKFNSASTRKQILNSGISPNKVLYRTFMKKVISQDSAIV